MASRTSGAPKRAGSSTSGTKTRRSTPEADSSRLDSVEQHVSPPPKPSTTKRKRQSETPATTTSGAAQADEQNESSRPSKKQKTMLEVLLPPMSSDEDEDSLLAGFPAKVTPQNKVPPKSNGALLDVSDEEDLSPPKPKPKGKSERRSDVRSKGTTVSSKASDTREESRLPHSKTKTKVVPRREERADVLSAGSQDEELRPRKSKKKKKSTSKRKSPSEQNDDLSEREVVSVITPIKVGPPRGVKRREMSRESGRPSKPGPSRTKPRAGDSADERVPAEESDGHPGDEVLSFGSPLLIQPDMVDDPALTLPPTHISIPQVPLSARPRSPELSPGARARLELFDRMIAGPSQDDAPLPPPDVPEHVPDDTPFNYNDTHDAFDTFDPPRPFSPPLLPPPSKPKPKHSQLGTPNGLVVPETESSGNSQSPSQPLLKPPPPPPPPQLPLARDQSPRKLDLPTIAVIAASVTSSSASPQDLLLPHKPPLSTNRPSKKPTFKISSTTFRSTTNARSRVADLEAPPSSIESFTSPGRPDKGKQRAVEDDQLQSGLSEGEGDGERRKNRMQKKITDSELKKRGKELFDQAHLAREAERQKNKKAKRLKTVNDIVNGTISSPRKASPLPITSGAGGSLEMLWEDMVDLSGGANSTTLDTPEHSEAKPLSEEQRERLRIELRQEEEESTQEAMGAYPPPPMKESDVMNGGDALMPPLRQEEEENTQEAMGAFPPPPMKESDVIDGGDAQMPPPRPPKVNHTPRNHCSA